jgi:2-keto-4-pentenoate hydratase
MTTSPTRLEEAAAALREAWSTRTPCRPVRDLLEPGDIDAAYAVQRINTELRIKAGERLAGRKIGLTARAVQQQFGIDQPDYGVVFDRDVWREDQPIGPADAMQPRVEAEIAIVLERAITLPRPGVADILRSAAYALPAIEVVGSRIANWDIKIQDTIADNASAQLVVLGGHPVPLDRLDLELCGMKIQSS